MSILGLLIGCSQKVTKLETNSIEEINYETLTQYMNEDYEFMLYLGRSDCSDCYYLSQMIQTYTDDTKTGLYYLDLKKYESSVSETTYEKIFKQFDFEDVPVLEVISKGKIKSKFVYLDASYFRIEDRETQKEERKKRNQAFVEFMNDYYEVDYEMS